MGMKARIAAGLVAIAGLAAGCSAQPGVAATVDSDTITMTELDDAMLLGPFFQTPPTPEMILNELIESRVVLDVASSNGIGVSHNQAAQFLDSLDAQDLQQDGDYPEPVLDLVRLIMVKEAVGTSPQAEDIMEEVSETFSEAEIEVSPRFSQWRFSGEEVQVPDWVERAD